MKLLGIVLQTQRFRESDQLLNILSEEKGRISCVARGVMRSRQRFPGGIDLWDSGYFELEPPSRHRGPAYLDSISQRERWPRLREDLNRFTFATYASELVLRLTEEDHAEDGALCRPSLKALKQLSNSSDGHEQAALGVYFSQLLLRQLGYDPAENENVLHGQDELRDWLQAMNEAETPILPHNRGLLLGGFAAISRNVQEILGRELRSSRAVQDCLIRLSRETPAGDNR